MCICQLIQKVEVCVLHYTYGRNQKLHQIHKVERLYEKTMKFKRKKITIFHVSVQLYMKSNFMLFPIA